MNRLSSIVLVLVVAACGDNHETPDAGPRSDAPGDAQAPQPRAVVVAGDFMSPGTGIVSSLDVERLDMRQNVRAGAALGDPVLRQHGDSVYVINRYGSNNITILDAGTLALVDQISTGTDSNPQDVAVVGNKLYVPALGTAGVVVLARDGSAMTTIDLSTLDDDGIPDCVSAYAIGTKVYVACAVLDNFVATEPGKIVVIDTANDTVVGMATMSYGNPTGFFTRAPEDSTYAGDLLIATVPSYTNYATGCVERVSTTGNTPTVGCGVTNQQLGGFAQKLSVSADGTQLYIAVGTYDMDFNQTGTLRSFDLESGTLADAPLSSASEVIIDVAACPGGQVVASDGKQGATGLRVWQGGTERTTQALSFGMPPTVNALVCYGA